MPMTGQPVFSAKSMTLTIFSPKTSPSDAAEDGEVLGEDADRAAVDRAVAGDDTVAVRAVLLQAEVGGAVPGELVQLDEGALVEQRVDALAGGQLALGVLLLHRPRGAGVHGLVDAALQVGELARGGVDVDALGDVGSRHTRGGGHVHVA